MKQTSKNRSFFQSLGHALEGLGRIFREERNFRYHSLICFGVVALGFLLQVGRLEWCLLILSMVFVLLAEIVNTLTEDFVDLMVEKNYHLGAKKIKDLAAGAVLVCACGAALIGILIFLPKIVNLIL